MPGAKCHEVWPELCHNCPLDALGAGDSCHIVSYDPLRRASVDLTAGRILWQGVTPAVVVTAMPHRLNSAEEQGLDKIGRMYAQSLVAVFGECVIVDLTADHYVNCQQDGLWANLPSQGDFAAENHNYALQTIHPDDLAAFEDHFSRAALLRRFGEGRRQVTRRLRRRMDDGAYHLVEFTAVRVSPWEEHCWCALVFRDVNEEYLLQQRRDLEIRQLVTAAGIAYQMLIAVNLTQNTYHMLEYTREPVPKPGEAGAFDDLIAAELATVHPDYQAEFSRKFSRQNLLEAYAAGGRIVSMEVPHRGQDGVYHWNFTQVVRVESPGTTDVLEITLSRNIDGERRQREEALEKERKAKQILEEALEKAEKASSAKSDFLSRMSHDIRTPLNAILGMAELAQLHVGQEEKLRDYLQKITASGTHLLGLLNEVLDVSKIESGAVALEETAFDLRGLVRGAVELVRLPVEKKRQALAVEVDGGLHAAVRGDERRLRQVLVNLLENASKYTGEGGHITFSLTELKKEEAQIGTYRFVVADDGVGMKPEYLAHIFEPFSRADDSRISKVPGTGLGMTIVKNIVAMLGGDIAVESEYGKGSRFTVTVCLAKCEAAAPPPVQSGPAEAAAAGGLRVLLAEDNVLNRQIATEMLELLGARVETAENGREAVEAVAGHPPFYYDMVFMDVQMPVLNGYDATRAIRALDLEKVGELPILAMTADAFAEDIKQARLAGMNGHLPKPISIGELQKALSNCAAWKQMHGR